MWQAGLRPSVAYIPFSARKERNMNRTRVATGLGIVWALTAGLGRDPQAAAWRNERPHLPPTGYRATADGSTHAEPAVRS